MERIIRDDTDRFMEYGINIPAKVFYMGGEVDEQMASRTLKGLSVLDSRARTKKLTIVMNNVGGDEYHGLGIYDAIKNCKSPTVIKVFGHAMSMGSWILQAADKRYLSPNSTMMLHYGSWGYEGHSKDFEKWSDECKRINRLMEDAYLERIREKKPRFTREELQELIKFDKFLTARDAVELGLADKIL